MNALVTADREKLEEKLANGYPNCKETWMSGVHDEVLDDPVPQMIIGKQTSEATIVDTYEDENVEVTL
jgi:hypothetical protein